MKDKRVYKLDIDSIKNDLKFKKEDNFIQGKCNLTHNQCNKFKLLPYTTSDSEKVLVSKFDGVIGAFSRLVCDKELKNKFNVKEFIENVSDEVEEFEGEDSKNNFKNIIKTMFINNDSLVDFDIKTMNYIEATNSDEKIARFLFSIFLDDSLKEKVKERYDKETHNILNKLVLRALPDLHDKKVSIEEYKCYVPFIKELFKRDFEFLMNDEELYKNSIQRFLEYYNMFYISQLCMKLNKFENAEVNFPEPLYYTLNWESTSKNRTAYKYGYENLKESIDSLFSHAITLELLNHHNLNKQLGYVELYELFKENDGESVVEDIEQLILEYSKCICDKNWDEFIASSKECDNVAFNKVYKLFDIVEFQFFKSGRSRAYESYKNWFRKFIEENFGKRRGSLGYNLNLTEEDIILLTKICINNNEKIKVSVLFKEFEKRGISFDRDSKMKIIQLYEKLNLLEKKSDSGDAQYVKSVL
ncbi:DNA phosphorothioation-dependent restriction protein DptG [Clostridium sp. ZS2]|uniref:DNA phosphorothioation-dependent restriction protein DptG n=1 Tax=Clostridium sp. ZS2 TaxID=2949988 RepID=UPI002079E307|nr:DNA phosphorothioation-dependent restriction protein DptG [Clostridium sp. ZS2]